MNIGVFDSGSGGIFIAQRLKSLLPGCKWVVANDLDHVPYGEKDRETITRLTEQAILPLIETCPIIVIACNTATAAAIETLRSNHPATQFVGIEPMVKPAAVTSLHHHITVLATPFTLHSERYNGLRDAHAIGVIVDEPDTTGWPRLIDQSRSSEISLETVQSSVEAGSDTIVLACTHYLSLMTTLREQFPNTTILEPSEALARQIQRIIPLVAEG